MAAKPWSVPPLVLPVGDKSYTIQPLEYDDGLTLLAVGRGKSKAITDKSEDADLFRLVMGSVWDEMKSDGCPYPVMFRAGQASLRYQSSLVWGVDPEAALTAGENYWETGLDPEAVAALMAAYQNQVNSTGSKPSTSTGSAPKTPRRASTSATTSRKATPRSNSKTGARGSRGTPSPTSSG